MEKQNQWTDKIKNFFNRITVKQILLIIIFGIAISIASCIIGYYEFSRTIRNTYNKEVEDIANLVKQNIDMSEYEKDIKKLENAFFEENSPVFEEIRNQSGYKQLVEQCDYLQKSFDGLDIFIANYSESYKAPYIKYLEQTNDQETLKKVTTEDEDIVAAYYRSANLTPTNRKSNYPGGLFLADKEEKESVERLYKDKEKQFSEQEMVMGDTGESLTIFSVEEPLLSSAGDIVGFINVSITVRVLQQLLARYLFLVGCLTILIGVIFILIYIHINRRIFLDPILTIIRGTNSFVENNNQISESLNEIKTGDEIQTLAESILKLEKDINEYIENLAEITAERERVQAELDLAKNIQMSMLPQKVPEIANRDEFKISAIMNPAREVGGDFYNYFMIDEDHLGFVVGDVSGKGVPAALFMMIGTILIKTESLPKETADKIMNKVNDILSDNNAEMLFITSWMGIYEISTGKVTFINAGHEPPLLVHENGEYEFVKTQPNLALGIFGGQSYQLNEITLKKGDKIFLYTDGVVEAQNVKEEFYKDTRLVKIVKDNYQKDVNDVVRVIREDIDVFAGRAEQFDDITIVGLELLKEPGKD